MMRFPPRSGAAPGGPGAPRRFSAANGALVATLLFGIALVPLWSVDIAPLMDYHNHLARQYILANLRHSEHLQTFYQADWRAGPYLAMDAIVQGLARFVSVDIAGRIFLSLMFLLVAFAPVALSLALHGRVTPIALLGLLTIHSQTLSVGFVHYLFSVGFALCLLALWIRLRESRPWVRLIVFPVLSSLLFFSHLIGFGIYSVTVGAYEFGRHVERVRGRSPHAPLTLDPGQRLNLISLALQFLLPLGIFALFGPSTTVVAQNTHGGIWRKVDMLLTMFTSLIPPYLWTLDRIVVIALPVGLVLLALMRRLAVARHMVWPLVAMLVFYLAMPWNLFGGFGADLRLLPAVGLLLAGSLTWRTAPDGRQPKVEPTGRAGLVGRLSHARPGLWEMLAFALIVALVIVRTVAVTVEWRKADREYAEYMHAFQSLTDGSKVYYGFGNAGTAKHGQRPKTFVPCLALATKQVYLPYLFTSDSNPGINMKYTAAYEPLQHLSPGPTLTHGQSPDWSAILDKFDYFLLGHEQFFDMPVPRQLLLIYKGSDFTLYKNSAAAVNAADSRAGG